MKTKGLHRDSEVIVRREEDSIKRKAQGCHNEDSTQITRKYDR
jgi:hypothetical protein